MGLLILGVPFLRIRDTRGPAAATVLVHKAKIRKNDFSAGFAEGRGQASTEHFQTRPGGPFAGNVGADASALYLRGRRGFHPSCAEFYAEDHSLRDTTIQSCPREGRARWRRLDVFGSNGGD